MNWRLLVILFLLTMAPGCLKIGPRTSEDVYAQLIGQCDELTGLLTKIDVDSTAKDKAGRVKKLTEQIRSLKNMKDDNDRYTPTPQYEAAKQKYDPKWAASTRRLVNQYQRLRRMTAAKEMLDDLQSLIESFGLNPNASTFKRES